MLCAILPLLLGLSVATIPPQPWSRLETVGGLAVNFTWRFEVANNRSAAAHVCYLRHSGATLPTASDLRYFYKTLPQAPGGSGTVFYLSDTLESTIDHPDQTVGERLCLVVSKAAANSHVVALAEEKARQSCRVTANIVVCRHVEVGAESTTTEGPRTSQSAVPTTDTKVCLDQDLFYGVLSGAGFILLTLTLISTILGVLYWRATHRGELTQTLSAPSSPLAFSRHSSKRSSGRFQGATAAMLAADYMSRNQAAAIGATGAVRLLPSSLHREGSTSKAQASMLL